MEQKMKCYRPAGEKGFGITENGVELVPFHHPTKESAISEWVHFEKLFVTMRLPYAKTIEEIDRIVAELIGEQPVNEMESNKDKILAEYEKGNVVFVGVEGLYTANLKAFIKQPADGLLYDLNRNETTVLSWSDNNPKWINDFAVAKVIRELKNEIDRLEQEISEWKSL